MSKRIKLPKVSEAILSVQGFTTDHFVSDRLGDRKENSDLFLLSYIKLVETVKIIENVLRPLNQDLVSALENYKSNRFVYKLKDYDVVINMRSVKRVELTKKQKQYILNHPLDYKLFVHRVINEERIYNNLHYGATPEFKIPVDDTPIALSAIEVPMVIFTKRDIKSR